MIGQKINGWEAVRVESNPKRIIVRHGCGKEKKFRCQKEFLENSGTCAKCSTRMPIDEVFKAYGYSAKHRQLYFDLSLAAVKYIVSKNCFYCGCQPSLVVPGRYVKGSWIGPMKRNGIDRLDSKIGYRLGNVVTACYRCNKAKGEMTVEEFYRFIYSVVR